MASVVVMADSSSPAIVSPEDRMRAWMRIGAW
jgi:hypothetical protein